MGQLIFGYWGCGETKPIFGSWASGVVNPISGSWAWGSSTLILEPWPGGRDSQFNVPRLGGVNAFTILFASGTPRVVSHVRFIFRLVIWLSY